MPSAVGLCWASSLESQTRAGSVPHFGQAPKRGASSCVAHFYPSGKVCREACVPFRCVANRTPVVKTKPPPTCHSERTVKRSRGIFSSCRFYLALALFCCLVDSSTPLSLRNGKDGGGLILRCPTRIYHDSGLHRFGIAQYCYSGLWKEQVSPLLPSWRCSR